MPSLTTYYNASFRSSSFWTQDDGPFSSPGADLDEEAALIRFPGGDNFEYQSFGLAVQTIDLPIAINGSDLAALVALHRTSGNLIYNGVTRSARLKGITTPQRDNLDHTTWKLTLKLVLL